MQRMRPLRYRLGALFALTIGLLGFAGVQSAHAVTFHGITLLKACNTTTKVGDPYVCQYQVVNADDNSESITVSSVVDVVHSAGGDDSSGNIIVALTWIVSTGYICMIMAVVLPVHGP